MSITPENAAPIEPLISFGQTLGSTDHAVWIVWNREATAACDF
jgi:hypothetical protein